ncbi:MAG: hypothetical protein M0P17_04900 [Methanoculleus sp.]|nr:hypothetical protein [Methanoculleus sp.]
MEFLDDGSADLCAHDRSCGQEQCSADCNASLCELDTSTDDGQGIIVASDVPIVTYTSALNR